MEKKYTAIIRKSKLEYVAICLELNVSARGEDLVNSSGIGDVREILTL